MKTSIRILALALVVLMSMAVLAGCGGKTEEAAAPEPQAAAPEAPAAPAEDGEVPPPPAGEPSGDPSGSPEPPAEFVPLDPAGDYSRDWAGYQAYLAEACRAESAFPDDEMRQQVIDQIAAATEADYDVAVFPYEMLIGMHIAVSYDEFLAA